MYRLLQTEIGRIAEAKQGRSAEAIVLAINSLEVSETVEGEGRQQQSFPIAPATFIQVAGEDLPSSMSASVSTLAQSKPNQTKTKTKTKTKPTHKTQCYYHSMVTTELTLTQAALPSYETK